MVVERDLYGPGNGFASGAGAVYGEAIAKRSAVPRGQKRWHARTRPLGTVVIALALAAVRVVVLASAAGSSDIDERLRRRIRPVQIDPTSSSMRSGSEAVGAR